MAALRPCPGGPFLWGWGLPLIAELEAGHLDWVPTPAGEEDLYPDGVFMGMKRRKMKAQARGIWTW
jgi:hypothetical protein